MVTTMIIRRELRPVILTLNSRFRARMESVTRAMDKPKERAILSRMFTFLKKMSVQAKPGSRKTMINPRSALMTGRRSRKGRITSNICLIGDDQSKLYAPFPLTVRLG